MQQRTWHGKLADNQNKSKLAPIRTVISTFSQLIHRLSSSVCCFRRFNSWWLFHLSVFFPTVDLFPTSSQQLCDQRHRPPAVGTIFTSQRSVGLQRRFRMTVWEPPAGEITDRWPVGGKDTGKKNRTKNRLWKVKKERLDGGEEKGGSSGRCLSRRMGKIKEKQEIIEQKDEKWRKFDLRRWRKTEASDKTKRQNKDFTDNKSKRCEE